MSMQKTINQIGIILVILVVIAYMFKPTPQRVFDWGKKLAEYQVGDRFRNSLAIQTFKLAIFLDKSFVKPYYEISDNLVNLAYRGTDSEGRDVYDQYILANAWDYLERAEKLAPEAGELHKCKAYLLKAKGDMKAAIKEAAQAVSLEPNNYRFHKMSGVVLLEYYFLNSDKGFASQAIKEFTLALENNPTNRQRASILDYLGLTYKSAFGRNQEAIRCYEEALKLNPDNWVTRHHYEVAKNSPDDDFEKRQNNYALAVRDFKASNNTKALYEVAKGYLSYSDYKKAEEIFEQVIAKEPRNYEAYGLLGSAYLDEGDNERALAAYMQAIKINPKYDFAYSEIGYIKHLQKDIPSSIEYCMKAISLNNKDASSYYRLATIYNDQGDSEKALQYCSRSIEADPENGDRYYPMAILVARQDRSAALPYLQKAVDLNTTYDYCYILLASFYVRQNQFEKAQQALEKAIENKKAIGADGFNGLAWCYVCQDINQEEAVLMADYARHLAPDKMEIVDTLNKAFINLGNKRMKENNFLMALFCYYMSIYVWIDSFFSGFLFLFIAGFLFLQLIPRLFFRYLIKKDALYYMFLWFIPLGKISFKNIEEIRLLNRFAGLKYIIHWNWRNRLIGKEVLIRKKAGLIRTIILTPGKPAVFVEEIKARVDNNFTPIATLVDSNG